MSTTVIVTYESSEVIEACLASLSGMRVIVVDNASSDGTADIVAEKFPDIELLRRSTNDGLAVAINHGLRLTGNDDVLILNPDTVLQPGALTALERYLATHPRAAIVAPRLLNLDGSVQESIRTFPTPLTMAARRSRFGKSAMGRHIMSQHLLRYRVNDDAGPVPWVLGAAMLVRRSAIDAVGGMDEWFFLYNEDIDWCFRMWRTGWEVHYLPEASVVHAYQRASTRRFRDREAPTRHHWASVLKLFVRHPVMLIGWSPPTPTTGQRWQRQVPVNVSAGSSGITIAGLHRMIPSLVHFKRRVGRS